ncbi:MAG: mercury methylation corrinoid protein HgcA [Planctomycetota bacterium]|jgi:acetyl-CoA decarbonylase/synthase complex subunit gamma
MVEATDNLSFVTANNRQIRRVSTEISWFDRWGHWLVRWGIGRMKYIVEPGLYAVGNPTAESVVCVSANYKLSFDRLRSSLAGRDIWILVIDTRGINVWCAAGKGTFCAEEIAKRARETRLGELVTHRKLLLPQLSAPGVSAHQLKQQSGFGAIYGPVRAKDIPVFLDAGAKATDEMRRVHFPLGERMVLIPIELVTGASYAIFIAACLFLLAGFSRHGYSSSLAVANGVPGAGLFLSAFLAGVIFGPMLLPWLPGRAFSVKGMWIGLALVAGLGWYNWSLAGADSNWPVMIAWLLIVPAVTSFIVMNFTGASTYTSLSGVRREMRIAVPLQAIAAAIGLVLWVVGRFV